MESIRGSSTATKTRILSSKLERNRLAAERTVQQRLRGKFGQLRDGLMEFFGGVVFGIAIARAVHDWQIVPILPMHNPVTIRQTPNAGVVSAVVGSLAGHHCVGSAEEPASLSPVQKRSRAVGRAWRIGFRSVRASCTRARLGICADTPRVDSRALISNRRVGCASQALA